MLILNNNSINLILNKKAYRYKTSTISINFDRNHCLVHPHREGIEKRTQGPDSFRLNRINDIDNE